ncbi:uncharacterized protein [Linepithema humile]|uniref:uncharacterized protein isoform X2 n=1 Tax=Linepithema humile TaxID=83485 RepID=UPI0006230187|nr:PREDICTED: uncharacterized protein LOC105674385 [Linepithema humile]
MNRQKFQIYMKKLAAVDDTLEKLGTPKTYRKLHMLSRRVIIGWIVYILIIDIYNIMWWSNNLKQVSWGILLFPIMNHSTHINEFTDLIFIFLLWYIGVRFDKTNDHLHGLLLKEEHGLKYMWKKPVVIRGYFLHRHNYKRTFWTSMHLHLKLCHIAREFNEIFGIQIIFEMVQFLGNLTSICYYIWRTLEQKHHDHKKLLLNFFRFSSSFFARLIRLYAVNHICESVKNKANNIDKVIHQLTNTLRYADIWKEIDFFVLHVMQHPLKFTGLGFFYLGNQFLQKFFTTIVTFVIIMVQLNVHSYSDTYN